MKFRTTALLITSVMLVAAACNKQTTTPTINGNTTTKTEATPDPFAATRGVFAKNCQSCHGTDGTGGPVKLDDGTRLKVPSLREGHALRHPDSDFRKQIQAGGDGMPAFKDKLNQQQIDDLIKFIRQEFEGGATPPAEKSVEKEKKM
jgi:mono/diheme cytochrome c family protein